MVTGRPRRAWSFDELRRYHIRPSRFNWGPENVHFGKTHFRDLNINGRVFVVVGNIKNYQAQLFYVLCFSLGYLKTAQNGPKFKKC